MDRIQFSLNFLSSWFLVLTGIILFYIFYRKRLFVWFLTGFIFLVGGINKIFDLDNRAGSWLLREGINFVNFMNAKCHWLKIYKHPGFIVDFWFLVVGFLLILLLRGRLQQKPVSYRLFILGVLSFLAVVVIGFNLATIVFSAYKIIVLQFAKDIFEFVGSVGFFLCFLTYSLRSRRGC